jgi:peptidoglycan/LPS O-acetylase OafA/YrhL
MEKKIKTALRDDIQFLRALSVSGVVLFHINKTLFPNGYLGVDLFFAISGYVLGKKMVELSNPNSRVVITNIKEFWMKRIFRLMPTASSTITISVFLVFLFGLPEDFLKTLKQALYSLLLIGNLGAVEFSGPTYWSPNPNPLLHTWSLSVEEQIYILVPIIVLILSRVNKGLGSVLRTCVFLAVGCLIVDTVLQSTATHAGAFSDDDIQNFLYYSPVRRFWEFGIGFALVNLRHKKPPKPFLQKVKYPAIFSLPLIFLLDISDLLALILLLVLFSIIVMTEDFSINWGLLSPIKWIGDRSYTIYLLHLPTIYLLELYLSEKNYQTYLCAIGIIILSSWAIFRYLENPIRLLPRTNRNILLVLCAFFVIPLILLFSTLQLTKSAWLKGPILSFYNHPECDLTASSIPCSYPIEGSKKTIMLVGDSHAASIADALLESAKESRISVYVWAKINCPFVLASNKTKIDPFFLGDTSGNNKTTCLQHNLAVKSWLLKHPEVVLVVTNRSWQGYRERFMSMSFSDFYTEIASSIGSVGNDRVSHFIGSTPEIKEKKRVLALGRFWQIFGDGRQDRTNFVAETALESRSIKHLMNSFEITYNPADSYFCDQISCIIKSSGEQVFFDYQHLSVSGSRLLLPLLRGLANA